MTTRTRSAATALLAGTLLAGLLPALALAAGPTATDDDALVPVDAAATTIDVLGNDIGTGLTIQSADAAGHGTVDVAGDGLSLTYTPTTDYHGLDTFDYTITDGATTDVGTVSVAVDTAPVAVNDGNSVCNAGDGEPFGGAFPVPEDFVGPVAPTDFMIIICPLTGNDTDIDGDPLTWVIDSQPSHGTAMQIGQWPAYRPDANFSTKPGNVPGGQWISDSFTYRAYDGFAYSQPASMRYWVMPVNDVPTFTPGGDVTVDEDSGAYSAQWATNVSAGPLEGDQTVSFLPDGPAGLNDPDHLFATEPAIDSNGVLTFTLKPDAFGQASVTWVAKDDGGTQPDYTQGTNTPKSQDTSAQSTFKIFVTSDGVTAVADNLQLPEDPETYPWPSPGLPNPWPVDVLANDDHPAGSLITGVTQGTLGDVSVASDGQSVLYAPHADANGADSFTYTLDDGAGASDTATVSVDIDAQNDPPDGADKTVSSVEDVPFVFGTADFSFSDTHDTPPNALLAVTITTLPAAGTLEDDGVSVVAGGSIPVVDITGGKLTFTAGAGEHGLGYASFTFQVEDDGGLVGVDLDPTPNTMTIDVGVPNHPPAGVDKQVSINEDTPRTLAAADFGFSDASDSPPDSLAAVKVTTLPTDGVLKDNGAAVSAGSEVAATDIVGGLLVYTPGAGASGNGYATFTFQVRDDGGTVAGGIDLDPTPRTFTIDVTAVNDAPIGTSASVATNEDTSRVLAPADFGFTDPNDAPPDALLAVKIVTLPTSGSLADNGIAVAVGALVPVADITGGKLVFTPASNSNTTATLTFQVRDTGGTANGGVDLDPTPRTLAVTINAANDAPNAVNDALSVPESAGATSLPVKANDTDIDGDTLTITAKSNGAHGTVAITGGGTVLTYDPVQLYVGTDVFTYTIIDGHGGTDTATVLVTVTRDTVKPSAVAPTQSFYNQVAGTTTTREKISWSGSDTGGTGIVKYQLQVSVNGGSYSTVTLSSATSTSVNRTLTTNKTYRFRVRATDRQGNVSSYVYGPAFRPLRIQNTSSSVVYTGSWATSSNSKALGGSHRYASSTAAIARYTGSMRDVAWIATKTTSSGSAQVWIDGTVAATINLRASSTGYHRLIFHRHFSSLGTHTIEIRPIGGGRVYLDAFTIDR